MIMEDYQFWTLVGLMTGGFGWMVTWLRSIDHRLNDLETRVTVIETILAMMGAPLKVKRIERADP